MGTALDHKQIGCRLTLAVQPHDYGNSPIQPTRNQILRKLSRNLQSLPRGVSGEMAKEPNAE